MPPGLSGPALRDRARRHYRLGNRLFDLRAMEGALEEWRKAGGLWRLAAAARPPRRERLTDLRAVILLLLTVLLVFNLVYGLFPRNSAELTTDAEDGAAGDRVTWWERWLDTGHPRGGGSPAVTLRDWWQRVERRWRLGSEEPEPGVTVPPELDERWPDLLSRYRQPGVTEPLDYHLVAGNGFLRTGDFTRAAQAFEQGLPGVSRPKQRADLYQGLANAHYYQGYRTDAEGLASYDLAQVQAAAQAYEASVRAEPRALSLGNLGWMYFLLGQYGQAEASSQRALQMEPNLHYVRLNLGLTRLVLGRNDEAYEAYRTVIRARPEDDVLEGGINDLREVLRDRPGSYPFGNLVMGLLARAKGDRALAQQALQRFLRHPESDPRWQRLAQQALDTLDAPLGGL
jgi:tetratricopeptide (TPR) repeat protein